ncbi:hypothetical protein [Streptococcus halichoeri]|uniref:hypothetical protein n=1 Tax=Streptococcus halichoeri TaxID=254785 RepID=UPI00135B07C7|nr:hypothetical protein [Streptococcus halichoeri]
MKKKQLIRFIPQMPRWAWLLLYLACLVVLTQLLPDALAFLTSVALAILFYQTRQAQKQLTAQQMAQRVQHLKDVIHLADRQHELLEDALLRNDYQQFQKGAAQLLPKLETIKAESFQLQQQIPTHVYHRINRKADELKVDIRLKLEQLELKQQSPQLLGLERIQRLGDEALTTLYTSIQNDHQHILQIIEKADNKAELLALHESSMAQFYDVLEGYLKIKEAPKDFYQAEERLARAMSSMQQFDLTLDETLRRLNESDLKDFEVSLRMMQDQTPPTNHV